MERRTMQVRTLLVVAFAWIAASAGVAVAASDTPTHLTTLDGQEIAVTGPRDKPLYLKFWATWCTTCRAHMPAYEALYQKRGQDVDFVAVNTGFFDTVEKIEKYQAELGITMPVALEPKAWLAKMYDVPRREGVGPIIVPYTVVINRSG